MLTTLDLNDGVNTIDALTRSPHSNASLVEQINQCDRLSASIDVGQFASIFGYVTRQTYTVTTAQSFILTLISDFNCDNFIRHTIYVVNHFTP